MARKSRVPKSRDLATNRAAGHNFFIERRIEAGIVLVGSEVKSIRNGQINLKESYCRIQNGEVFLHGAHVSPYEHARGDELDPVRTRKLLLHAREIRKLAKDTEGTGMTLVPTRMYLKAGRIKIEIGVARGKRAHDKRESMKNREAAREMDRARRERY